MLDQIKTKNINTKSDIKLTTFKIKIYTIIAIICTFLATLIPAKANTVLPGFVSSKTKIENPVSSWSDNTKTNINTNRLSNYARNLFKITARPDLDEKVFSAMDTFENNKNQNSIVKVYSGGKEDTTIFANYFNMNYGFIYDIRLSVFRSNEKYFAGFKNTMDADRKIDNYINEAEKAKTLAQSLIKNNKDETILNIINYVHSNGKYYYSDDKSTENMYQHYYGFYSGKEILCVGFANVVCQLCNINGINAKTIGVITNTGLLHQINQVEFSTGWKWVDSELKNSVKDTIWDGFSIYSFK